MKEAQETLNKATTLQEDAKNVFSKASYELALTVIIDEDDCDSETVELTIQGFDQAVYKLIDKNKYYETLKNGQTVAFTHIYDRDTDVNSLAKLKAYALSKGYTPYDYFDLGVEEYVDSETKVLSELPIHLILSQLPIEHII